MRKYISKRKISDTKSPRTKYRQDVLYCYPIFSDPNFVKKIKNKVSLCVQRLSEIPLGLTYVRDPVGVHAESHALMYRLVYINPLSRVVKIERGIK